MQVYTRYRGKSPIERMFIIDLLDQKDLFFSMKDNVPIKTMITSAMPSYKIKIGFDI